MGANYAMSEFTRRLVDVFIPQINPSELPQQRRHVCVFHVRQDNWQNPCAAFSTHLAGEGNSNLVVEPLTCCRVRRDEKSYTVCCGQFAL